MSKTKLSTILIGAIGLIVAGLVHLYFGILQFQMTLVRLENHYSL